MSEQCGNCRFWIRENPMDFAVTQGFCRRNPPQILLMPGKAPGQIIVQSQHPPMGREGWCGEWEQKVPLAS